MTEYKLTTAQERKVAELTRQIDFLQSHLHFLLGYVVEEQGLEGQWRLSEDRKSLVKIEPEESR